MLGSHQNRPPKSLLVCWKDIDMWLLKKKITSFVDSYAVDLIHDIINQRFIPGKHFALSMGLETQVLISLIQIVQEQRHVKLLPVM